MTFPDLPITTPTDHGTSDGGGHIEYELDDWAMESRQMLRQLLVGAEVPHVWEAGRLVIPEVFEAQVDDLVDQTAATFSGTLDDADVARVVFDVSDFDDDLIDALLTELGDAGVDWALEEGGDLVVPASFTDTVAAVVEKLEFPHALAVVDVEDDGISGSATGGGASDGDNPDGDDADDGDDDVDDVTSGTEIDPDRVLGGLFVAADRLTRSISDSRGVLSVLELETELAGGAMPFGFDEQAFRRMRTAAAELASMLTVIGSTDDEVEQAATTLRDLLRPWV
jgi:hypothetical protein